MSDLCRLLYIGLFLMISAIVACNNQPEPRSGYFRVMFNGANMAGTAARFAFEKLGLTQAAAINDGSLYTVEKPLD